MEEAPSYLYSWELRLQGIDDGELEVGHPNSNLHTHVRKVHHTSFDNLCCGNETFQNHVILHMQDTVKPPKRTLYKLDSPVQIRIFFSSHDHIYKKQRLNFFNFVKSFELQKNRAIR